MTTKSSDPDDAWHSGSSHAVRPPAANCAATSLGELIEHARRIWRAARAAPILPEHAGCVRLSSCGAEHLLLVHQVTQVGRVNVRQQ